MTTIPGSRATLHPTGAIALFIAALAGSGCMKEVSPGHYVLGFNNSPTTPMASEASAASPAPAAAPAPPAAPAPAAAPMAAAPAPAAPAAARGADVAGAPQGNWASQLPTTTAVKQAIHGTSSADTAARQEAAFATLADYVETLNGMFKPMTPELQKTFMAYTAEASKSHPNLPRSVSPAATPYFDSLSFRQQTLSKVIARPALDYYAANSLSISDLRRKQAAQEGMAASASKQAATERVASDWQRRVQPDVAKAKKDHTTLLGIAMGVPPGIPSCAQIGVNPLEVKGGQLLTGVGLGGLDALFSDPSHPPPPPPPQTAIACAYVDSDGSDAMVWLQVPPWVLSSEAIVKGGLLVGGRIVAREDDALFKQLIRKYGSPTSTDKQVFQNTYGARAERMAAEWRLPGVYVKYSPRGGNMQVPVGDLVVELDTIHRMRVQAEAEQELKGPQL